MKTSEQTHRITIGNTDKDKELIMRITEYKKERNFSSLAEAVRSLCRDALDIKRATK